MFSRRYILVLALLSIPTPADAGNSQSDVTRIESAIRICVTEAQKINYKFDAFYNQASGKAENNVPTSVPGYELESWENALYTFRKCMASQGWPLK
jgi:hypothetical protein